MLVLEGLWTDELKGCWLVEALQLDSHTELFRKIWTKVCTKGHDGRKEYVNRDYGLLDQEKISRALGAALMSSRVPMLEGRVIALERRGEKRLVQYIDAAGSRQEIIAGMVVDATGFRATLSDEVVPKRALLGHMPKRRYQAFFGEFLEFPGGHQLCKDTAVLMDWSMEFDDTISQPSFVYVLPIDEHTVLVEETVLLSDEPIQLRKLKRRLQKRKAALFGLECSCYTVKETEMLNLPMGGPFHSPESGLIQFGGSNNMSHAATGYMFGFVMDKVPRVALCVQKKCRDPVSLKDRVMRRLNDMGAFVLSTTTDRELLSSFLQASLRTPLWYGFMTRRISLPGYIANMCMLAYQLRRPQHLFWLFRNVGTYALCAAVGPFSGLVSFRSFWGLASSGGNVLRSVW